MWSKLSRSTRWSIDNEITRGRVKQAAELLAKAGTIAIEDAQDMVLARRQEFQSYAPMLTEIAEVFSEKIEGGEIGNMEFERTVQGVEVNVSVVDDKLTGRHTVRMTMEGLVREHAVRVCQALVSPGVEGDPEMDILYRKAAHLATGYRETIGDRPGEAYFQRRLKINYSKAKQIVERLEIDGVIPPRPA